MTAAGEKVGARSRSGCTGRSLRPPCWRPCPRRPGRSPCSTAPRNRVPSASRSTSTWWPPSPKRPPSGDLPLTHGTPRVIGGRYGLSSKEFTPSHVAGRVQRAGRRPAQGALHRRHLRRRDAPVAGTRPRGSLRPPRRRGAGDVLRARLRRHRRGEQVVGQDHRRGDRPLRPGVLRLRLQEVGVGHRVAPAVRSPSRSARPTSSTTPTSSPATSPACWRS